jgi:Domain of unknown function (DUF6456)
VSGEGEVEREARRLFRKLAAPGAYLAPNGEDEFRLVSREEMAAPQAAPVRAALVETFLRRGWIKRAGPPRCFVLSDAGHGWLLRAVADEEPFAAQHRILRTRTIRDANGVERRVVVDEGESPLARLKQRGLIDAAQFDAGEKLRRDFTLAQLMPRLGVDYEAPVVLGRRGLKRDEAFSDLVLAAKQRFGAAMRAVGAGLSDLLFDVCCHWRGLEETECANQWPSRSARVVLAIALDRLADHYGMRPAGRARMRAWTMEDDGA